MKLIKKWLVLTQYYPPEIGAPQIRLRSLVRELVRRGYVVEVLTAMPNYPSGKIFSGYAGLWKKRETIDGVTVRRTWVFAGTGKSARIRLANYLSFTVTAFIDILFGPRPDVLFVESQPLSLGLIAVLMKWLRGVPYIYNVPDLQIDVAQQLGFMRNPMFLKAALFLENLFLKNSWKVSTVTHRFIEHFKGRGIPANQITFLPNGADTEFLKPSPPSQSLINRWGLEGKKVFMYVGTHAYYHGLDTLLQAAEILFDEKDIVFLMIGDGPERPRLKATAVDLGLSNVIFGESPYEEMDQLYSIAYASVATLRNIEVAQGMRLSKIFPSLSCCVPVIYAGKGEAAELIEANHCGVVVPPEHAERLADAIKALARDSKTRNRMGLSGRNLVEREYSWTAIVDHWLEEIGLRFAN